MEHGQFDMIMAWLGLSMSMQAKYAKDEWSEAFYLVLAIIFLILSFIQ